MFYLIEVLFHLLIVVDIDQREDHYSFLIHLFLIFVVLFVLIEFVNLDDFVLFEIIVHVNEQVQLDEVEVLYELFLNHFVLYAGQLMSKNIEEKRMVLCLRFFRFEL